jgi:hypothetical protein
MKKSYQTPRVVTQVVRFGLYGDYGTAGGEETFGGGPAAPFRLPDGGANTGY